MGYRDFPLFTVSFKLHHKITELSICMVSFGYGGITVIYHLFRHIYRDIIHTFIGAPTLALSQSHKNVHRH